MNKLTGIIVLILLFYTASETKSQISYRINNNNSSVLIQGTSSLHDWEMDAGNLTGNLTVELDQEQIRGITGGRINLKSEDIKSHNSIMDNKAQSALKSDKYPEISFSIHNVNLQPAGDDTVKGHASETLTIAEVSRDISSTFTGKLSPDKQISINGKFKVDMLSYNIDPPTAMMGALKTGSEVGLSFNLVFQQDTNTSYTSNQK